jgi:hypothetical protein
MKSALEHFLDDHLPLAGVVACAIRLPDRSIVCRRDGDAMTTVQVEQVLARMALAADGLKRHRVAAERLCWTFDYARIHLTHRPDGTMLAIFCDNGAGQPEIPQVHRLMENFHELTVS